ncbi:MAG: response regulator [candidate division Zixibacteria bacterium]|nr:response regulator [candidate division Zixibacteria bacterium]
MDVKKVEQMVAERGQSFKVLIVDDEPRIREIFRDFCELTNSVEVDMAVIGADAVSMVEKGNYDLVTMDLIMPEMAGVEAVSKIKNINPHLPVIVITGNATERLVNQAGVKGASSILYKPVLLDNFLDEVISTLEKSSIK